MASCSAMGLIYALFLIEALSVQSDALLHRSRGGHLGRLPSWPGGFEGDSDAEDQDTAEQPIPDKNENLSDAAAGKATAKEDDLIDEHDHDDGSGEEIEILARRTPGLPNGMRSLLASLIGSVSAEDLYESDDLHEPTAEEASEVGENSEIADENADSDTSIGTTTENSSGPNMPDHHNINVVAEVQGLKITMIVDTGASISLMAKSVAHHLGLISHVDSTMQGSIEGIGEASVLGILRNIPVQLGRRTLSLSFFVVSVTEPLLLLGVDQLRQLKCVVDLDRNILAFGGRDGFEVPLLPYERKLNI